MSELRYTTIIKAIIRTVMIFMVNSKVLKCSSVKYEFQG